jgi:hypothetical protein
MILGMDWLEAFSPMKVDWRNKWMIIPYGSDHVQLYGVISEPAEASVLQLFHIAEPASTATSKLLPAV